MSAGGYDRFPPDVGIIALEFYFPRTCVSQADLEKHDNVGSGKYQIGLGQDRMAFVGDREDINSISLTAVKNLLEKYNINPKDIGRLEVGTETIIDKSKATKTALMQLFKESGNLDMEGIDTKNACYGGTSALFNAINWVESSSWDGRLAIVVAADIAVYAPGPARPTGGCGAAAMLIGPNAALAIERGVRGSYMDDVWDFYKPIPTVEWPTVDGQLSNVTYLKALDSCYDLYRKRFFSKENRQFSLDDAPFICFHAPYNKLVQRSFSRLVYNDFYTNPTRPEFNNFQKFSSLKRQDTYNNAEVDKTFMEFSKPHYQAKVSPSTLLPKELGNSYTASLYAGLVSLVSNKAAELEGKRILMFSYGSGCTASMFSLVVKKPLKKIAEKLNIKAKLAARKIVSPVEFNNTLAQRAEKVGAFNYAPKDSVDEMFPGTYYLTKVDDKHRRFYARTAVTSAKL